MSKKNYAIGIKGVEAHLTWPNHKPPITVSGIAVDDNGFRIDRTKLIKRTAHNSNELDRVKEEVVAAVKKDYARVYDPPKKEINEDMIDSNGLDYSTEAVQAFFELDEMVKNGYHFVERWKSDDTYKGYLSCFKCNILPEIQYYTKPEEFSAVELNDLKNKLKTLSLENKRSIGIEENANSNAKHKLDAADLIYREMRSRHPDLLKLSFSIEDSSSIFKRQQIKSLPENIHLAYRNNVEKRIETEPYHARGGILVDSGALRSGEGAASWQGLYEDKGDYIVVWVLKQEYEGKRIDRLKRPASYRCVVLDEWGTEMLRRVNKVIGNEVDDGQVKIKDDELSAWIKKLLVESGCTKEFMADAYDHMLQHPEYDKRGIPIKDVSAHILRRNRASIWRNYCGYTQEELDYYLGHEIKKSRFEYDDPHWEETQKKMSLKNSRYDICPESSISPKHKPIKLKLRDVQDIIPFTEYVIENNCEKPVYCNVMLRAAEAGDSIDIITDNDIETRIKTHSTSTGGKRMNAEIIGELKDGGIKDE